LVTMSVNIKILGAFTGKQSPILLKIKGSIHKALINFAEIRIPKDAIKIMSFKGLEDEYNCIIKGIDDDGAYIFIMPRFVKDVKMLCSSDPEQTRMLKEWYEMYGANLIKYLLKRRDYVFQKMHDL